MATPSTQDSIQPLSSPPSSSVSNTKSKNTVASTRIAITLTRETNKSWGILLAKGGDDGSTCIVMRVPKNIVRVVEKDRKHALNGKKNKKHSRLRKGDVILLIRNEFGHSLNLSSKERLSSTSVSKPKPSWLSSEDWFVNAVGMFKKSKTLHLT